MCALTALATALFGLFGCGWFGMVMAPPPPSGGSLAYIDAVPITANAGFVGRTCAAPALTGDVPSATNWVFAYTGAPLTGSVQLVTEAGGVWHADPDQPCDAQGHWPLGIVRRTAPGGDDAGYRLYAAPYPEAVPVDGQPFRLIVNGVEVAATTVERPD